MLSQLVKAITKALIGGENPIGKTSTSLDIVNSGKVVAEALVLSLETGELAKFTFKMKCAINTLVRESKTALVKLVLYALQRTHLHSPHTSLHPTPHISPAPHTAHTSSLPKPTPPVPARYLALGP